MTFLQIDDESIELNDDGHLAHFQEWNDNVARALALKDNLELEQCHWAVIHFLRDYYTEYATPPSPRVIIKSLGHELEPIGCTMNSLKEIFPLGGCAHACKLAGLPRGYCHSC